MGGYSCDNDDCKIRDVNMVPRSMNGHIVSCSEVVNERKGLECQIPDLPVALVAHESIIANDAIVVCGGSNERYRFQNKCYQLTNSASEWKEFPEMKHERAGFGMIYLNKKIWAVGGFGGGDVGGGNKSQTSMDIFDFDSMTWSTNEIPLSIREHCMTKIDEFKFIVTGGMLNHGVRN